MPRRFGWLGRLMPTIDRPVFLPLINSPEMQAIYERAPQVGRILRPWCEVFGLETPAWLRLPKRARKKGAPTPAHRVKPGGKPLFPRSAGLGREADQRANCAATAFKRRDARGEMIVTNRKLPPREQAEDAIRRSEASGKPIDVKKFKAEAYGWFVHPPRDGNCPPPKIGYGGRLRPLPKDYKPPKDWE